MSTITIVSLLICLPFIVSWVLAFFPDRSSGLLVSCFPWFCFRQATCLTSLYRVFASVLQYPPVNALRCSWLLLWECPNIFVLFMLHCTVYLWLLCWFCLAMILTCSCWSDWGLIVSSFSFLPCCKILLLDGKFIERCYVGGFTVGFWSLLGCLGCCWKAFLD